MICDVVSALALSFARGGGRAVIRETDSDGKREREIERKTAGLW
jgi:hypothetical protein